MTLLIFSIRNTILSRVTVYVRGSCPNEADRCDSCMVNGPCDTSRSLCYYGNSVLSGY